MLVNKQTVLQGNVALIPYRKEHVLEYHDWMKDPFLLETTCSEPLSLEEEYEMQLSWQNDPKKLTFIIATTEKPVQETVSEGLLAEYGGIIGDVNLYFNDFDDENCTEIEIMIADQDFRGKGLGKQCLLVFMDYARGQLGVSKFVAKIGMKNFGSKQLFTKLGYVKVSESMIFEQETFELTVPNFATPSYTTISFEG